MQMESRGSLIINLALRPTLENRLLSFSGFLYGLISNTKSLEVLLKNPLSTMLNSAVNGILYTIATNFVGGFFPRRLRYIIIIILMITSYKHLKDNNFLNRN